MMRMMCNLFTINNNFKSGGKFIAKFSKVPHNLFVNEIVNSCNKMFKCFHIQMFSCSV